MKKKNSKGSYLRYFREHIWKIILMTLFTAFATAGSLYSMELLSQIVESLEKESLTNVAANGFLLLAIYLATELCLFVSQRIWISIKFSVIKKMDWELARKVSNASVESVSSADSVEISEKMKSSEEYVNSIYTIFNQLWNIIAGLIAAGYCIYTSTWHIAVLITIFFVAMIWVQKKWHKVIVRSRNEYLQTKDHRSTLTVEILNGFVDAKSQGLFNGLRAHFSAAVDSQISSSTHLSKIETLKSLISHCMQYLYECMFIFLGIFLISSNQIAFSGFVRIFLFQKRVYVLSGAILETFGKIASMNTSVIRMDSIRNYTEIEKDSWGQTELRKPKGDISLKNVSVTIGNISILDDISFDIPAGTFVGLVGESGSGKSTLLKAIGHAQSICGGQILFDGIDSSKLTESSYRNFVAYAPQMPYIFNLSIAENLRLADPNASDHRLRQALKMASAEKFAENIDYTNTRALSGGEQQRLALARIPLCGSRVILLDESTSALDNEAQKAVMNTVRQAAKDGHTMIMAAHRLNTLVDADMIVVLDKGKIVAKGTYQELLATNEYFRRLVSLG